jgi:recombination protein RecR
MAASEIERMIQLLARLPGLGPRSARRAALHLIERRESLLRPLAATLARAADAVRLCGVCGNMSDSDPCPICDDPKRDPSVICVVEDLGGLWAMERSAAFKGRYHVLGGTLSALDGRGPEQLNIAGLARRCEDEEVREVILALTATVEGQTTAHYIGERLEGVDVKVTKLGQGVPVGGALDYLDDGTLMAALRSRQPA